MADWSQQARDDLVHIFVHVARYSRPRARKLVERLRRTEQLTEEHPLIGRIVPEFDAVNIREVIMPPYRVIYQVRSEGVLFLTVIHGRQDLRHLGPASYVVPGDEE